MPRTAPDLVRRLEASLGRALVGKPEVVRLAVVGLLARGHLLIEDVPGVGKTTLAPAFARSIGAGFQRIQFTSDMLPSDVLGVSIWDPQRAAFVFKPGPLFTNIVLADEINRTTPKTQSALLEAMNEAQVSLDHTTHALPRPFMVLATQNPREYEGTYPLPESQLDRFLLRIRIGYPEAPDEKAILRGAAAPGLESVAPVAATGEVLSPQAKADGVRAEDSVLDYLLALVTATRTSPLLALGVSPRGSLALFAPPAPGGRRRPGLPGPRRREVARRPRARPPRAGEGARGGAGRRRQRGRGGDPGHRAGGAGPPMTRRLRGWWQHLGPRRTIWPTREGAWYLGVTLALGLAALNTGNNLVYLLCSMLLSVVDPKHRSRPSPPPPLTPAPASATGPGCSAAPSRPARASASWGSRALEPVSQGRQAEGGGGGVRWPSGSGHSDGSGGADSGFGGGSAASPSAASTRRTAWGWLTAPRMRHEPPQRSQTSTWIANTRRRSRAQVHRPADRASTSVSSWLGTGTMADRHWACGARTPW